MAITKSTNKIPAAATDNNVDLWWLDQTKLKFDSDVFENPQTRVVTYAFADGDPALRAYVTVRIVVDSAKQKDPMRRITIKFHTLQLIADSVAGTTLPGQKIAAFIGFEVPADGSVSVADLRSLLSVAYGLTADTVTTGVMSNALITELAHLVPTLYS
jgi:hypothetical protein